MDTSLWFGLATDLLDCACAGLEQTERGCPGRACVVPGASIVEDNCCQGQLQVLMERIYRTVDFPAQTTDLLPCGGGYTAMDVLIALRRCAPDADCVQQSTNAELLMADGMAMWAAIQCCLDAGSDVVDSVIRDMRPSPGSPNGGCVGWDLRLTIGVPGQCSDCGTINGGTIGG